ncbi:MAG: YdcF family protein [bacterium]
MNKKRKIAITLISVLVLLIVVHAYILTGIGKFLIVSDKLKPADVIVVLAGDGYGDRVNAGVKLYQQKFGKSILMSGGPLAWRLSNAEWMKRQAVYMGVPASAIMLEENSRSTLENAWYSLEILRERPVKRIILVTSDFHTRRAGRTFKKIFKKHDIEVIVYPAADRGFHLDKWWLDHESTQRVIWEYFSLLFYLFKV